MRLTLRTLLAYLDDVLDPVDKEELAKKIESSEFAEDLVHRTRDTVRRLRLSAPQVIGTGMGLDPNTVAEYLDNVMSPEQVGDFERICLESDVHLAEATACHHVLTMILGEPADVDPIARQRMYTIATEAGTRRQLRVEPGHRMATAAAAAPAPSNAAHAAREPQPQTAQVPEYLRAGSWWPSTNTVIGLAAVVLIGTAVVLLSGLRDWLGGPNQAEPVAVNTGAPAAMPAENGTLASQPPVAQTPAPPTDSAPASTPLLDPSAAPPPPLNPGLPPLATPAAVPPVDGDKMNRDAVATPAAVADSPAAAPIQAPADSPLANVPQAVATDSLPPPLPAASTANPALPAPSADLPREADVAMPPATSLAGTTPPLPVDTPAPPPLVDAGKAPAGAEPAAPPVAGTYMAGKTVLLRHDDESGAWFRVEPRAAIVPGERVVSLPEFRPRIALSSGIQLDLSGGTQVIIGSKDDPAPTAGSLLELVYGRIVLVNPTNTDQQIQLKLGSNSGMARIGSNATLAVELERKHVPGQDPRHTPAPVQIRLFAPDGRVHWQDAAGDKSIEKPSRWTLADGGAGQIEDDAAPPEWIDHEPIVQLSEQRYGAPVVESTLTAGAPVDTQLLELFQGNTRKEVRSLVARSASHVGLFQPFVDALRDSEQKANWKTHIDTLRGAMAQSPESAEKVFQTLADQRGKPAAADLYEMLCGYNLDQIGTTPDQLKLGAVLKLINWLEVDSLDYRVLAVQNLWEITGKRLMPNPAASLAERQQNIRRWRSRLESGELKPAAASQQ